MQTFLVDQVFTPFSYPEHTYVARGSYENTLRSALSAAGSVVSLTGPSKCGKTVLCTRLLRGRACLVAGGSINEAGDVWRTAAEVLGIPGATEESEEAEISGGVPVVRGRSNWSERRLYAVNPLEAVSTRLNEEGRVLVLDDFHYVSHDVQRKLAQQLKGVSERGARVVVLSVPQRGEDAVRANPDLRGRVQSVVIDFWAEQDLKQVANLGWRKLCLRLDPELEDALAKESLGSPQIMQALCLELCRHLGIEQAPTGKNHSVPNGWLGAVRKRALSLFNCETAYTALSQGPLRRGRERTMFLTHRGESVDIYQLVLFAAAQDPPHTLLDYADLTARLKRLVKGKPATGSQVVSALEQMSRIVSESMECDQVLVWASEVRQLSFPDPHFLFYVRERYNIGA